MHTTESMRILIQGGGAIGQAAAAMLIGRHEVAVASRAPRSGAVFPVRVPTVRGRRDAAVTRTRRVPVIDWADAVRHDWDLVLLTTRPGDLDAEVVDAVRTISPRWLLTTSQVGGDLNLTRAMVSAPVIDGAMPFGAQSDGEGPRVLIAGPCFLSARIDDDAARAAGTDVRYWMPPATSGFLLAGDEADAEPGDVARDVAGGASDPRGCLRRVLGPFVLPVPLPLVVDLPRVFIPFAAELTAQGGEWQALLAHLERPSRAAAEALTGMIAAAFARRVGKELPGAGGESVRHGDPIVHRLPSAPPVAGIVLRTLEAVVPIGMDGYAGRHFARHRQQALDMLAGWADEAERHRLSAAHLRDLRESATSR